MSLTQPVVSDPISLQQKIAHKIAGIARIADELPAVVIIHNVLEDAVEYMSPRGLRELGISLNDLKSLGNEYHRRFFNPEDAADYVPKLLEMLARNDDQEIITFFQQVRPSEQHDWAWHFSSVKVLMRTEDSKPLLCITLAFPIDPQHHITTKVARLLEENNFLKKHYHRFSLLTKREQEVLKAMAVGKSSPEIAAEFYISAATCDTHRRNIRRKLGASSAFELFQYARAFDLV